MAYADILRTVTPSPPSMGDIANLIDNVIGPVGALGSPTVATPAPTITSAAGTLTGATGTFNYSYISTKWLLFYASFAGGVLSGSAAQYIFASLPTPLSTALKIYSIGFGSDGSSYEHIVGQLSSGKLAFTRENFTSWTVSGSAKTAEVGGLILLA